jgi:hypothetical protein
MIITLTTNKNPQKKNTGAQQLFFFSWRNSPKSEIINERLENQVIFWRFSIARNEGGEIAKITIFPYLV